MHSTRFLPSSPLISLALLVGCGDTDPVTIPGDPEAAQFAAAPAASRSGAEVIRDIDLTTILAVGPPTNLALAVGYEDVATECAGGDVIISPHRGQAVVTPSGKGQLHTFSRESFVQVFNNSEAVAEICDLPGAGVVASGTVTFSQVVHEDEVPGAPGAFSLHATVKGTVDLTSGGQARLSAMWQFVVRPDGTTVLNQVTIRLTPI
jgi:hypothetical protein